MAEVSEQPKSEPVDSAEEGVEREESESARTRTELVRWKHVRRARWVVVLMALSCFIGLTREPWTLTLLGALLAAAYLVSQRTPLLGLIMAFAAALPGWAYTLVEVLDWAEVYYPSDPEGDFPAPRVDVSAWQLIVRVAYAIVIWRGLAAAARLTGEVERSWQLLRPTLLLSIAMALVSSFALMSESLSGVGALCLEGILIVGVAPTLWRARDEWGTLGDPRRLAPLHALETVGLLIALVAFMAGYLRLAGKFGIEELDSVHAYLLDGWPEYAVLVLIAGFGPLVEEILFRGFVQSRIERVTTPRVALVAQAMLFSAMHAVPGSLVSHAIMGLALGFLRNRTGTLYAPLALHSGYNAWVTLSELGHLPELLTPR